MSDFALDFLLSDEVQQFIVKNIHQPPTKLLLSSSSFSKEQMTLIVGQIQARRKALLKLPEWLSYSKLILPTTLSLEQSSSEITARFKANYIVQQVGHNKKIADLTGGFGVDTYYFSKVFETVHYIEQNEALVNQVMHNFQQLQVENVTFYTQSAEGFLQNYEHQMAVIYLDPARRDQQKNKVFHLEDCSPNILNLLDLLWLKTEKIFLKLAPMLDIELAVRQLDLVKEVLVVAVNNECKELLFLLDQSKTGTPKIKTVNLSQNKPVQTFDFTRLEEGKTKVKFSEPKAYLYEPNVAILKAGAFKIIADRFKVEKLHQHSHLYTSEKLIDDFPGRRFRVKAVCKYAKKEIIRELNEPRANISTRNFPESVVTIRKKLKIKEGGDTYIFFTQTIEHKARVIITEKV